MGRPVLPAQQQNGCRHGSLQIVRRSVVFPGSTASDDDGVLINAQEGKTKALRQWRFSSIKEIKVRKIKAYIREAIEL